MTRPRRLRAYALTGGRTHARTNLGMEALIVATHRESVLALGPESEDIRRLCSTPHSLVDLSAALDMPLGVIRVLVSDLLSADLVSDNPVVADEVQPTHTNVALLGELLDGIEAL